MTLRGAVDAFPLETVLQLLAVTGKTGLLQVRGEERSGELGLSGGRLVSARSDDEEGELALGATFTIRRGDFEVTLLERIEREDLAGELDDLLDRAVELRERVIEMRAVIPHDRIRFQLSARAAERAQIKLSAEQWRVLLAVDGQRDVEAIARQLGIRTLAAVDLLAALVRAGMVDTVEPPADEMGGRFRDLPAMPSLPPTGEGEPVVLRGSIPDFPLGTVVELVAATKKTGRLDLSTATEAAILGFADGELVSATWEEEAGELALGAAFAAERGEFDFVPTPDAPAANLHGAVEVLLRRAAELRDQLVAVRAIVPSEGARFVLSDRATRTPEITLTSDQWRALLAVNGERDVVSIAEHLGMRRLETTVLLADLVRDGLIDVAALPPSEPSAIEEAPQAPPEAAAAPIPPTIEPVVDLGLPTFGAGAPAAAPPAPTWEPAAPAWGPAVPLEEAAAPEPAAPAHDAVDPRLAAFGLGAPAPAEPAQAEPEPAAPVEPAIDTRLAAFGIPAEPAATAWEAPTPTWQAPAAPPWEAPAEAAIAAPPAEAEAAPAVVDQALDVAAGPAMPAAPPYEAPVVEAPPAPPKRGGLFGLFRREAAPAPVPTPVLAGNRAGQLAAFANELVAGYNSGQYGKGRVEERMLSLLMRVDEQADPIDRPIPVVNDRLDVPAIEGQIVPERQAVPYLATLVGQIYDDAERVLGRDKAKRGFREIRERLFGKDLTLFQAPEVAGRVPKV